MKKFHLFGNKNAISIAAFLFFQLPAFFSFAQMDNWILHTHQIQFNEGVVQPFGIATAAPYGVENAVFRKGVLQFYANSGAIYDAGGNYQGVFSANPGTMLKEIAIAPVPGDCGAWYLLWVEAEPGESLRFLSQEIRVVEGEIVWGLSAELAATSIPGHVAGIAVSHILEGTDADRDIYLVASDAVRRFRLSGQGIALEETIELETGGDDFICEADLSPDGKWLGWANGNQLFALNLTPPYLLESLPVGNDGTQIRGIEFYSNSQGIYFSHSALGLRKWPLGSTNTFLLLKGNNYRRTQIEKGGNGQIYAVRDDGTLGRISRFAVKKSKFELAVFSDLPPPGGPPYFGLPDQVDGEDYGFFSGTAPLSFAQFEVNETAISPLSNPAPFFYTCQPVNLETEWTGAVSEYSLRVYSIEKQTGGQVWGSFLLNYAMEFDGPPPPIIDLRCLASADCDLFGISVAAGYLHFAVELTLKNRCDSFSHTGYFQIYDAPPPGQIGLQINPGTGIPCPASHDIGSPCPTGIYSASLNMSNSQGNIGFYQLEIEESDCETGETLATIYTGLPIVPSLTINTFIAGALNYLVIDGNTGYFADSSWLNRCLKLTATLGNICGASTDYTYLRFAGAYFQDPGETNRSAGAWPEKSEGLPALSAFPNPFSDELFLRLRLEDEAAVSLTLVDASGRIVARPLINRRLPAGESQIIIPAAGLAPGIYTVHFNTEKKSEVVRVVRAR